MESTFCQNHKKIGPDGGSAALDTDCNRGITTSGCRALRHRMQRMTLCQLSLQKLKSITIRAIKNKNPPLKGPLPTASVYRKKNCD